MPSNLRSEPRGIDEAKQCLRLIREIADRSTNSCSPQRVSYALQELSQVLLERTGTKDRVFDPDDALDTADLFSLRQELEFVNDCSEDMARADWN